MFSYLIEIEDFVIQEKEAEKIIKTEHFEDITPTIYDLSETTLDSALEDLDTYSFLSSKKIIVIRSIELAENEDEINHLLKYIDNPNKDNLLIIETKGFKSKKDDTKDKKKINIEKELKKKCKTINTEFNSKSFIKDCLKGYKISTNAVNLLDEYCLEDYTKIESECSKLKNYKIDEKEITEKDIKELVTKKLGDPKNITFSFARNLGEKNIKKALGDYHALLEYNVDSLQIIGLLASQFRIIYQVKLLASRGLRDKEIAAILGEKEFRVMKTKELIPMYSEKEILKLIQKLSDIDLRIKTTDTNPINEIELFIINI